MIKIIKTETQMDIEHGTLWSLEAINDSRSDWLDIFRKQESIADAKVSV